MIVYRAKNEILSIEYFSEPEVQIRLKHFRGKTAK